jgi:hypothetical protein
MFSRNLIANSAFALAGLIFAHSAAAIPATPNVPADKVPPTLASCVMSKLVAYVKDNPGPASPAFEAKRQEILQTCGQLTHQNVYDVCDANDSKWLSGAKNTRDFLMECQTPRPDGSFIKWTPTKESIFVQSRPTDGFIKEGRLIIYQSPPTQRKGPQPQGELPDTLYGLLFQHDTTRQLFPLNFSADEPAHVQMPWRPGALQVAYDAAQGTYLLYVPPGLGHFVAPAWDSSIPSWEAFYVWWFDPTKATLSRKLLPAGPWVADAKRDMVLGRAARNFSCGTDCYRHYDIEANAGSILVTISGRSSAVSDSVIGTYRLNPGEVVWKKVKDGQPEPTQ